METKPCSWCTRGPLQIGSGLFRDFDSDLSYGIPICPGCGGLGVEIVSDDFKTRTKRIGDLRSAYCPVESVPLPDYPVPLRLKALKGIEREITELWTLYGANAPAKCPAASIAAGGLRRHIQELDGDMAHVLQIMEGARLDTGGGRTTETRDALIAAFKGDVDAAEELFQRAMAVYPDSSIIVHDYASFLVGFKRSYKLAAPHFERSCEMEPKRALHYFQAARCFAFLKEDAKVRSLATQARACTDFITLEDEDQRAIREIIEDA